MNNNLTDPYTQNPGKSRSSFVFGDDFTLSPIYPKVHVTIGDIGHDKITAQKTTYLEEDSHSIIIYYYNFVNHYHTFENGEKLQNEKQCREYLNYIQEKLKEYMDDFKEYFHRATFGTIPKPTFNNSTSTWLSVLPMNVMTYKR